MKSDQCFRCKSLFHRVDGLRCLAYPDGIPAEILSGEVDHSTLYPGDGGHQFTPSSHEEAASIEKMMYGI